MRIPRDTPREVDKELSSLIFRGDTAVVYILRFTSIRLRNLFRDQGVKIRVLSIGSKGVNTYQFRVFTRLSGVAP